MTPAFVREVALPCATCMARAVLIGTAIASAVTLVTHVPQMMKTFGESKTDVTQLIVKQYALEAFPAWEAAHPDRACPRSLAELVPYMSQRDGIDAWGTPYYFACGAHAIPRAARGIWVVSAGEDRMFGTDDDLRSDE